MTLNACQAVKPNEISKSCPWTWSDRRPRTSRGTSRRAARRRRRRRSARPGGAGSVPRRARLHLRRRGALAASSVLRSSIAIVIGPTPPGTGVISPARSTALSKSTSPTSPSSVRLMPTSITAAPGLTQSPGIMRGRPTAATSTSARRQTSPRSRVREWQTVTVAFAASSSAASGRPTRSERPTTTASAPCSGTSWRRSSSITPAGVHGRSPGRPWASRPADSGVSPSTSLPRRDQRGQRLAVDLPRRRELEQDPGHALGGGELAQQRLDLLVGGVLRQPVVEAHDPDLGRRLLLVADVDGGSGIVADQHRRQPRRQVALGDEVGDVAP